MLLNMNERRGNQATGLALQDPDGMIHVFKADEPAWRVTSSDEYADFLEKHLTPETVTFIGHTRLATLGSPRDANNNHPLFNGTTAVVHNGHINNHDHIFRDLKTERKGEVDSDVIRAILDEHGFTEKGINMLSRLSGSAAIAAISTKYPGKVLLGRSGNPIVLAGTDNLLVWSSEKQAIHTAMRPLKWQWGFPFQANKVEFGFHTMNNDTAYILGEPKEEEIEERGRKQKVWTALEWHQKLNISNFYTAPNYSNISERYGRARKLWGYEDHKESKKKLKLRLCGSCGGYVEIQPEHEDVDRSLLRCSECKGSLVMEDELAV